MKAMLKQELADAAGVDVRGQESDIFEYRKYSLFNRKTQNVH